MNNDVEYISNYLDKQVKRIWRMSDYKYLEQIAYGLDGCALTLILTGDNNSRFTSLFIISACILSFCLKTKFRKVT